LYRGLLDNSYVSRPLHAELEAGWTTPYLVKGITVYISDREAAIMTWLFNLDIALLVLVLICGLLGGVGPRPPNSN
jgi:hypothetical protein